MGIESHLDSSLFCALHITKLKINVQKDVWMVAWKKNEKKKKERQREEVKHTEGCIFLKAFVLFTL